MDVLDARVLRTMPAYQVRDLRQFDVLHIMS